MITDERLAELRALCDAAAPGPWTCWSGGGRVSIVSPSEIIVPAMPGSVHSPDSTNARNLHFVAVARTELPEILDEVERRRNENAELRAELAKETRMLRRFAARLRKEPGFILTTVQAIEARAIKIEAMLSTTEQEK